jgi:triphosphatase
MVQREVELKLQLSSESADRVLETPLLLELRQFGPSPVRMVSTYFDTPHGSLHRARAALRVRRINDVFAQTFKAMSGPGGHDRLESEVRVSGQKPDLSRLPEHFPMDGWSDLRARLLAEGVGPEFTTEIHRTRLQVGAEGWKVEVALDKGQIQAGDRREQVRELELEVQEGPVWRVFDLAVRLLDELPFRMLGPSKAARGAWLARGAGPDVESRSLPDPVQATYAPEARRDGGYACIEHALAHDYVARQTGSAKALEEVEIALSHLRTLLESVQEEVGGPVSSPAELEETLIVLEQARREHSFGGGAASGDSPTFTRALLLAGRQLSWPWLP